MSLEEIFDHVDDPDERATMASRVRHEIARRRRAAQSARRPRIIRQEKRCPRCQTTKPIDAFARSADRPDGRQGYCRACRARRPDH